MRLLSPYEARAHVAIINAISDYRDHCINVFELFRRAQPALECFSPRCNCGSELSVKPEIGRRVFSCPCGAGFVEHL